MFGRKNNIMTEPIPERVFELCKIVSKGDIPDNVAKERMEPSGLNKSVTYYYPSIREVCVQELKLIEKNNDILKYVGDKGILKSLDSFRKFCNSTVLKDSETAFYKIVQCFLESDDSWLKYKTLTDVNIRREVQEKTKIASVEERMMLGTRFWISFLGFGYIQEAQGMYFLPNMHIALQDYCEFAKIEKNKEYSIKEFIDEIYKYGSVALQRAVEKKEFNAAMSNALRQMHDRNEIVLKKNLDSKEKWKLFYDNTHEFTDEVTHIVFKGVKRG